jgi:hypothetical protein
MSRRSHGDAVAVGVAELLVEQSEAVCPQSPCCVMAVTEPRSDVLLHSGK